MFCRLGLLDDILPVEVAVWLNRQCSRPVCGQISAGSTSK
jgi:hypothetical protein